MCDRIAANEYEHIDVAKYQMHLHATKAHFKAVMKKKDLTDMVQRLEIMYPRKKTVEIPIPDMIYLPEVVSQFVMGRDVAQVVWMYNGTCTFYQTGSFKSRYAISRCGEKRLYTMAAETLGFSEFEAYFKMWLESLYNPGTVIKYQGLAFRQDIESTVVQEAKMMSIVLDYSNIITAVFIN